MRLFSYKMIHDSGFAPNPFFGIMTMATCKPAMRRSKKSGDWIAGFTSAQLGGDGVGQERLVFLMQVSGKMSIAEYFRHPDFQNKIPNLEQERFIHHAGDNIYRPLCPGASESEHFEQLSNPNHWDHERDRECPVRKEHDVKGRNVLLAKTFYYFGREPLSLPLDARPVVPKGQSGQGSATRDDEQAQRFLDFVSGNFSTGIHHAPFLWPRNDSSWRNG